MLYLELSSKSLQNPIAMVPIFVVVVLNQACLAIFNKCHKYMCVCIHILTPSRPALAIHPLLGLLVWWLGDAGGGVRTKFLFVLLLKPAFAADTGQVRATLGQSAMKGKAALAWGGVVGGSRLQGPYGLQAVSTPSPPWG